MKKILVLILFLVLIQLSRLFPLNKRQINSLSNNIILDAPKDNYFKIDSNSRDTLFDDPLYVILLSNLLPKQLRVVDNVQNRINERNGNMDGSSVESEFSSMGVAARSIINDLLSRKNRNNRDARKDLFNNLKNLQPYSVNSAKRWGSLFNNQNKQYKYLLNNIKNLGTSRLFSSTWLDYFNDPYILPKNYIQYPIVGDLLQDYNQNGQSFLNFIKPLAKLMNQISIKVEDQPTETRYPFMPSFNQINFDKPEAGFVSYYENNFEPNYKKVNMPSDFYKPLYNNQDSFLKGIFPFNWPKPATVPPESDKYSDDAEDSESIESDENEDFSRNSTTQNTTMQPVIIDDITTTDLPLTTDVPVIIDTPLSIQNPVTNN